MHAVRWLASPRQGAKALLNDFWYFSSLKSTIKEKYLYDFLAGDHWSTPCLGDANTHASHMCQFPY